MNLTGENPANHEIMVHHQKNRASPPAIKGTYLIVMSVDRGTTIPVGRLGTVCFKKGHYVYVGSAFGPGGLAARIGHHLSIKTKKHWHLDYLDFRVREVRISKFEKKVEHEWAGILGQNADGAIPGFGCSDCSCASHLLYFKTLKAWQRALAHLSFNDQTNLRAVMKRDVSMYNQEVLQEN